MPTDGEGTTPESPDETPEVLNDLFGAAKEPVANKGKEQQGSVDTEPRPDEPEAFEAIDKAAGGKPKDDPEEEDEEQEVADADEEEESDEESSEEPKEEPSEIEQLRNQVQELARMLQEARTQNVEQQQPQEPEFEDISFFGESGEDDEYELPSTRSEMNQLLNKVVRHTAAKVRELYQQEVPQLVKKPVQDQVNNAVTAREFFRDNPDLKGSEDYVGFIATELRRSNPKMPAAELLEQTAVEARKRMGLAKKQANGKKQATSRPFGKPSGTRPADRGGKKPKNEDDEILENILAGG